MYDVALRLGLQGGTEVERGLKAIGKEGRTSLNEIRQAARGLPPHMVAVSRSVATAKDAISDLASRAPGNLGAVAGSFGVVGTAAAAAGVVVAAAGVALWRLGEQAAAVADELDAAAKKAGVGVEELQRLRFVAGEADVEVDALEGGLRGLNASLGAFKSGVGDTRVKKVFEALGITRDDLRGVRDASDFLTILADRLNKVRDQAERVKFAKALGVEELLPLLRMGSGEIRRLGESAESAGQLIDAELVSRLADLNREMEKADQRLKNASTRFGAEFTPSVAAAKTELAKLLDKASGASEQLDRISGAMEKASRQTDGATDSLIKYIRLLRNVPGLNYAGLLLEDPERRQARIAATGDRGRTGGRGVGRRARAHLARELGSEPGPGYALPDDDKPATKRGKSGKSAAEVAREQQEAYEDALAEAAERMLSLQQDRNSTIGTIAAYEERELDLKVQARQRDLARQVADKELTKAQADAIEKAQAEADARERRLIQMREWDAAEDHELEQQQAIAEMTAELLSLATASARTQEERRRLQLEMLELERKQARAQLKRDLDRDPELSSEQREERLALFDKITSAMRGGVERSTMGPLEAYRDSFLKTSDEVREALESAGVDGFKTLNDGILDAIRNSRDLNDAMGKIGDAFGEAADRVILEMQRIAIQRFILQPLLDMLGALGGVDGNGNAAGGGWLGTLTSILSGGLQGALGGGGGLGGAGAGGFQPGTPGIGFGQPGIGWGRATGGPVYRGDIRPIGEQGRELMAFSSDGYIHDAAATARMLMDAREPAGGAGGGTGSGLDVRIVTPPGVPLKARVSDRPDPVGGGRRLDVELFEMIDRRVEDRFAASIEGGRDDQAWSRNFGVRRNLTGG